ncbi:MAG: universal stress protein [Sandaracinaceae bacterium]|nr:universal stress protein [Sandaracinaceae bacterium]
MKQILACVDFSPTTPGILAQTKRMASARGADVVVLHVAPGEPDWVGYGPGPQSVRDQFALELREAHAKAQALADELRAAGIEAKALSVQGPAPEKILEQADALGAELIVIGSRGHSVVYDLLVGSVAQGVLRGSKVPVLVVPVPPET